MLKNLSLERKEMKNSSPFTVVIEIALLMNRLLAFFSIFLISFFGTSIKVSPKKILLLLNLEWKNNRWDVTKMRPAKMILSDRAQELLLMYFSFYRNSILFDKNYACLFVFSPKKHYFLSYLNILTDYTFELAMETISVSLFAAFTPVYCDSRLFSFSNSSSYLGFLIFLKPSILLNSPSKMILEFDFKMEKGISSKNFIYFFTESAISSVHSW